MSTLELWWRELRLQQRYGIFYAAAVVVLTWAIVLWPLPDSARTLLLPAVLVMDTAIFGFFLMTAMMFLEKSDRVLSAIVVTPLTTARYLIAKVAALTLVAVVLSVVLVVLLMGAGVQWALLVAGIVIGSVMTMFAGFVLATRFDSMNQYIMPSMLVLLVVQAPAIHYFDLWTSPLFYVLPTMAPLVLVRGALTTMPLWEMLYGLGYGAVSCVLLLAWARRAFDRFVVGGQRSRAPRRRTAQAARPFVPRGRLAALIATDIRNLRRDPVLLFMAGYAVLLAVVGRWLIPWLIDRAASTIDLTPYVLLIVTFLAVQTGPLILGSIAGLMLLDERDERSLEALRVTPLPLSHYALYRTVVPVVLSVLLCFMAVWVVGLVEAPVERVAMVAVIAALEAPIGALALASFASNKVEGLAFVKGLGIFMFAPVLGWFVEPPWRWLIGIVPTLWPAEAFWQAVEPRGSFWIVALVGLAMHLLVLWLLLRRFRSRM